MKISGFTIIKNAIVSNYPIIEAITSILPVVDEMIVLIGDSEDETFELIKSINSPKIRIHHSVWDKNLRTNGDVLAIETNKAFQLIDPSSTWAFYIQADEVVHESFHHPILNACQLFKENPCVQGLLFDYLHFYGSYDYVADSRKWYNHEVRIIRNDKNISAFRDAQGFRINNKKLHVKAIPASIYHYGWVKSPQQMQRKIREIGQYWDPSLSIDEINCDGVFDFSQIDSVKHFTGTHPAVMQKRIGQQHWQLKLNHQAKQFSLKDRLLYYFEKLTGIRPFTFNNYVRIK